MKKLVLFHLLCCLSTVGAWAQPLLTNRQIYDFDIGDVFMFQLDPNGSPPTSITRIVTGKSMSTTLESVTYTMDVYAYTPQSCQTCPAIYDTILGEVSYYNHLDDTVGTGLGTPPVYIDPLCIDTTGFTGTWLDGNFLDSSFCQRHTVRIHGITNVYLQDSCLIVFEPILHESAYGEGLGLRYYHENNCALGTGPGCDTFLQMVYYRKGLDSCGLRLQIPASVQEAVADINLSSSPNPFGLQTRIEFGEYLKGATVTLCNLLGETLQQQQVSGTELLLDGAGLESGIYFLKVACEDRTGVLKLLRE